MLGKKIKFKIPNVPSKKFLKGKFVILEPVNPSKHSKDLFKTFSLDKQGLLWKYMPDGPFKNLKQSEEKFGFDEAPPDQITNEKKKFFNLGPDNDWETHLPNNIRKEIEINFMKEMKELII